MHPQYESLGRPAIFCANKKDFETLEAAFFKLVLKSRNSVLVRYLFGLKLSNLFLQFRILRVKLVTYSRIIGSAALRAILMVGDTGIEPVTPAV